MVAASKTSGGQFHSCGRPRARILRIVLTRLTIFAWYFRRGRRKASSGREDGHWFGPVEKRPASGWSAETSLPKMNAWRGAYQLSLGEWVLSCLLLSYLVRVLFDEAGEQAVRSLGTTDPCTLKRRCPSSLPGEAWRRVSRSRASAGDPLPGCHGLPDRRIHMYGRHR
jgi:hypothetical protein